MAKKYTIVTTLDVAPGVASADRLGAAFAKMEQRMATSAAGAEKASSASSDRAAKAAEKAAERQAAAAEKAAKRAEAAAARQADQVDMIATRVVVRDEQRRRAAAAKADADARRDADLAVRAEQRRQDQLERIQDNFVRRDMRRRAAYEAQKQRAAEKGDSWADAIGGATGFSSAVTKAGAAMLALNAGKDILGALAQGFADAHQAGREMAQEVIATAAGLREIAMIKGKFGPDVAELAQHIDVRRQSGLTREQAKVYQEQLGNTLGTVSTTRFPVAERKKLEVLGAQYAARTSKDEAGVKARAGYLGLLPDFIKGPGGANPTARDVVGYADAVDTLLGRGAFDQTSGANQYAQFLTASTAEGMTGSFQDPRKAAGILAVASKFGKDSAADSAFQAVREVTAFTKMRKKKGLVASQAQTLTEMGIKETDEPDVAMQKMFEYSKGNLKDGEAFQAFLGRRGFGNADANKKLGSFYAEYLKGNWQDVMKGTEGPVDLTAPEQKNAAFQADPISGRPLLAQAALDAARVAAGLPNVGVETARTNAAAALTSRNADPAFGPVRAMMAAATLGTWSGKDVDIERRAAEDAQRAQGITPGAPHGLLGNLLHYTIGQVPHAGPVVEASLNAASGNYAALIRSLDRNSQVIELQIKVNAANAGKGQPSGPVPANQVPNALPRPPAGQAMNP